MKNIIKYFTSVLVLVLLVANLSLSVKSQESDIKNLNRDSVLNFISFMLSNTNPVRRCPSFDVPY